MIARLDNAAPTISVLLPVHNAERYLRAAVKSVLDQTFDDFELLALDDGSTDTSLSILREFEVKDSRVHVFSRENRGIVSSLNELIAIARGHYLARMDSDDICRPHRFEEQIVYLDAHLECVAVGTRVLFIDPEGLPICEVADEFTHEEIDAAHLSGVVGMRICHPSAMMRREAVVQIGQYREEYQFAEDLDLFLRIAEIGRLANLSEVLLEYRQHLGSICYSGGDRQRQVAGQAVRAARIRRGLTVRPGIDGSTMNPETRSDTHRKWAWWALTAGNLITARKHAIKALAADPFSIQNLRAAACAIRGY